MGSIPGSSNSDTSKPVMYTGECFTCNWIGKRCHSPVYAEQQKQRHLKYNKGHIAIIREV